MSTPANMPDPDQVREALGLSAGVIGDTLLAEVVDAAAELQAAHLTIPPAGYTAALRQALIRRVGRAVNARGIPLGAQNTEFGTMYVPQYDSILQELEAPYRPQVIA